MSLRGGYLAEMMDRKGRLSLAEASVVLTPLSMIMPAWGVRKCRDRLLSSAARASPHAQPGGTLLSAPGNQLCSPDALTGAGDL